MTTRATEKALLTCPGDTIQETIDAIGMTQRELAERLGYPFNKLNQLIKGEVSLTPEMAVKLEHVLGIPVRTWLELERMYQEDKLAIDEQERLAEQFDWLSQFPLSALKKWGIIGKGRKNISQVEDLLSFFQVASKEEWERIYKDAKISVAFKISLAHTQNPYSLSVWLRLGEKQAEKLELSPFDEKLFKGCLEDAREMAYRQPDDYLQALQALCASCGAALVYTPLLPNAPVNGATRWLKKRTHPLLQLSDRYKTADHFWFAFFHEAAHILKHGKTEIFLDGVKGVEQDEEKEAEANRIALKYLLGDFPLKKYANKTRPWSEAELVNLAKEYRIHPGILAAQLQRVGSLPNKNLNGLKVKVMF
ncbi:MAG: helix-turn-helix domain-containing protein [Lewinellaceae bacterium]|nr:helix-turn-helix domain-containing protein [Lewinellaceae bacterium]